MLKVAMQYKEYCYDNIIIVKGTLAFQIEIKDYG